MIMPNYAGDVLGGPSFHGDSHFLAFRAEPVTLEYYVTPSLPLKPYYYAPLSGGSSCTFLGHPTPVPAVSVGVADPHAAGATATAKDVVKVSAARVPNVAWTTCDQPSIASFQLQPRVAPPQGPEPPLSCLSAPVSSAAIIPTGDAAAVGPPLVAYAIPTGADNRWASLDYLLPRESREGLGGEHRFTEQRKLSSTSR